MKVYIGPYSRWVGPYQIANWLQKVGVSEDSCDKIGDWLSSTWLDRFCNWVYGKCDRKVKIRIDNYDVWDMSNTLAYIVVPMLKSVQAAKHGAPLVDDEDVPEHLRSTAAPPKDDEHDIDDNHFKRWDYVIEEMQFAFQAQLDDWEDQFYSGTPKLMSRTVKDLMGGGEEAHEIVPAPDDDFKIDWDGLNAYQARISNGLRLFGKYYQGLWT